MQAAPTFRPRTLVPPDVLETIRGHVPALLAWVEEDAGCGGVRSGAWTRFPCPIHEGTATNFAVQRETGAWTCHACGAKGGGLIDYAATRYGLAFPDAVRLAAQRAGIALPGDDGPPLPLPAPVRTTPRPRQPSRPPPPPEPLAPYTLDDLAREKALPRSFLQRCGLREGQRRARADDPASPLVSVVVIPHRRLDGSLVREQLRVRLAATGARAMRWARGEGVPLYGLEWLAKAPASWGVVIVEGATDALALARHARALEVVPVGVPGVSQWPKPIPDELRAAIGSRPVFCWLEPPNNHKPDERDPYKIQAGLRLLRDVLADYPGARVLEAGRGALAAKDPAALRTLLLSAADRQDAPTPTTEDDR